MLTSGLTLWIYLIDNEFLEHAIWIKHFRSFLFLNYIFTCTSLFLSLDNLNSDDDNILIFSCTAWGGGISLCAFARKYIITTYQRMFRVSMDMFDFLLRFLPFYFFRKTIST